MRLRSLGSAVLAAACLLTGYARAQTRSFDELHRMLPMEAADTQTIAIGDGPGRSHRRYPYRDTHRRTPTEES